MPTSKNVTSDIPRLAFAPGLEATQGARVQLPAYVTVSFSSKKEYEDDSEGWTTVKRGGRRNKVRHVRQTEYYMY